MIEWLKHMPIKDQISLFLALAATISMIIHWNRMQINLRIFTFYPLAHFGAIASLKINIIKLHLFNTNEGFLIQHLGFFSYTILAIFFYKTFVKKSLRIRTIISIILFFFLVRIEFYSPSLNPVMRFSSFADVFVNIFVIYMCFAYFRQLLRQDIQYRPEKDRTFWVVTGLFFYFIFIFFTIGLLVYIASANKTLTNSLYNAQYAFNYLFYGLLILINFNANFSGKWVKTGGLKGNT